MANDWDATIKLLYAADSGTKFVADTVDNGKAFDVVADIEIGENLNEVVNDLDLFIGVRNLTQSSKVLTTTFPHPLVPKNNQAERVSLVVPIAAGWTNANVGDLLEVVATLRVNAGVNTDYSHAEGNRFVAV
jgi:hypothetical protein